MCSDKLFLCTYSIVFQNESLEVDVIDNIPKAQTKSSSTLPIIEAKSVNDSRNKIVCLFVHTYVYVH